jgi:hypothetical protein
MAPQKYLVLAEIWLLIMADSEHTSFICGMIGTYYLHSDIPSTFLYTQWGHTKKGAIEITSIDRDIVICC